MNPKKYFISVLFVCICSSLAASELQAAQKTLNISMRSQEQNQWCWAACSQSYVQYKTGNFYSQCDYVKYIFGSCVNQAGTAAQIVRACSGGGASASSTGVLSFSGVQSLVDSNRPFIVGRSGHAMVGFGYKTDNGQYVAISDPWPGRGKSWYTYSNLSSGWFVTVR